MINEIQNSCILNLHEYYQHFMTKRFEKRWRRNRIAVIRGRFFFWEEKEVIKRKTLLIGVCYFFSNHNLHRCYSKQNWHENMSLWDVTTHATNFFRSYSPYQTTAESIQFWNAWRGPPDINLRIISCGSK